jgi:hypothetical protein
VKRSGPQQRMFSTPRFNMSHQVLESGILGSIIDESQGSPVTAVG